MRRPSITFLIFLGAAIYIVWVALTVGELWPFQRMFDAPPESRHEVFFRDLAEGTRSDISPREAHLLWVIRDPEPADGTFDTFARNFGAMLRRASPLELPVVIPLDILVRVTGESFILTRLIVIPWIALTVDESVTFTTLIAIVAAGLILATATYTLLPGIVAALVRRHRRRPTLWPLLFGGLFVCAAFTCLMMIVFSPQIDCSDRYLDDIDSAIGAYLTEHTAGDPVITIFEEDSRFAHFAATQDLRLDNRHDLSEREYTSSEINAIIEDIDDDRIWVLFERGAPHLDRNLDAVLVAVEATDRGIPFARGPVWMNGPQGLSDHWLIHGYDANSDILWRRGPDIATCW